MTNEVLVEIINLSKQFDLSRPPVLHEIHASIPKGEMVGLAGPDGSGKTTLLRLIAGLLLPTTGSVRVAGYETVQDSQVIPTLIGYMPQRFGLYEELTVLQNLTLYADLKQVLGEEREKAFEKLLHFTALKPFVHRLAGFLSGGMKQKLGLACALVKKPTLLLLDEPSVGVDPISRMELWKMVENLVEEGISVIWSTAYLDEAQKCRSVLLLNEGKLLYHGSPEKIAKRVEGRTFKLSATESNPRRLLAEVLKQPSVLDAVIQGKGIRFVSREKTTLPLQLFDLHEGKNFQVFSTPPRFEDAFVEILGGGPGGWSALADKCPPIKTDHEVVVDANRLVKRFGSFTAVDHVSFRIYSGEIFGLLGPNGAGKSTTFKMMCGLLKPTEGEAHVNGFNLQTAPGQARSQIGYMAQKFSLYGNLSVQQNLEFFSGIYSLSQTDRRKRIGEMVDIFGLQPYLHESAEMLPLGFKQRLSLACSVIHYPPVLFLDEPTSGVDPITRREFWNHINGLVNKGVTVLVTTHFMDEAEYCDRIGLIYKSRLIVIDTPDALKQQAQTENNPNPSLEEAFIHLIENYQEEKNG